LKIFSTNAKDFISPQHLKELRQDCENHKDFISPQHLKELRQDCKNDKLKALDRCIEDRKLIKGYDLTACGSAAIGAALVYLEVIAFPMFFTALAAGVIGLFVPMAINVAHEKYENLKFEPKVTVETDSQPSVS
jgi:hypothetical protein